MNLMREKRFEQDYPILDQILQRSLDKKSYFEDRGIEIFEDKAQDDDQLSRELVEDLSN